MTGGRLPEGNPVRPARGSAAPLGSRPLLDFLCSGPSLSVPCLSAPSASPSAVDYELPFCPPNPNPYPYFYSRTVAKGEVHSLQLTVHRSQGTRSGEFTSP